MVFKKNLLASLYSIKPFTFLKDEIDKSVKEINQLLGVKMKING